jgi:hypothetical protein
MRQSVLCGEASMKTSQLLPESMLSIVLQVNQTVMHCFKLPEIDEQLEREENW